MPEFILILIRSVGAFLLLLIMTRIMGKKQLSQLTFFDYCVGITIGSVAATMSVDQNVKIIDGLVSLAIWGIFPVILGIIGLKSRSILRLTDGRPAIIIKNGNVLEKSMKKNQLAIDELMMLLRERGVFKVADVEMAVLETNGELSVMKKIDQAPITPHILGMALEQEHAPTLLIVDGNILNKNLSTLGYSHGWLLQEIQKQGAANFDDVFLAQVDSKGNLYVDLYNETIKDKMIEQRPSLAATLRKLHNDLDSFSQQTKSINGKNLEHQQATVSKLKDTINSILPYFQ
ncbi:DUF421 domain-containing protein [Bacillus sp. Marseille-P3661]|uniref:DUF421 domain-containing protein n=1 Tax=Bacillus sp. Marseille-P3661 TaxID=1936234 RepID=UPI000C816A99|nr:DUF421 domain-containing protein [Bacillus sp. Marseille-P3661]